MLEEAIFTEEPDIRYVVRAVIEKFARDNGMRKPLAYNFCAMYVAPRIKVLQQDVMPDLLADVIENGHGAASSFSKGLSKGTRAFFNRFPHGEGIITLCEGIVYDMIAEKSLISDDARETLRRDEKLARLLDKLAGTIVEW